MHKYKRLLAVFGFLALLFAVFELSGLRGHFNLQFLQFTIRQHQIGGLLIFILLFSLGNLIHIPGWVFLAAAVLALGRTMGGMVTYIAASVACVTTFFIIRYVGGDALRKLDNKIAAGLLRQLDAHPIRSVALLRVMFQTVPALNYTLAMSGVSFRQYLAGTLLGLPLPIMLYCLFFDYLAKGLQVL
jgi:uncharacterized membrane protein YdjX (TVP38/TMEM64 family)